nr:DegQ family serine endoprotease [Nitratireductor basaltis]
MASSAVAQDGIADALTDLLRGSRTQEGATAQQGALKRVPFSQEQIQLSFAPLIKETAPAVVNVYASSQVEVRSPFAGDPFFERFFDVPRMPPRVQSSLGSGVIVDADGIIVTNYHVIRGADEVKVALADGREFESEVLLKDEGLDLAVLKISNDGPLPSVSLGDSEALEVGDLVLAIGNPFGVGQTTTSGIVSALARTPSGITDFGFFIQTDAAINPGNSGGALVGMNGSVVGINTAIFSRSGGSNGIGFAIPANIVRVVVEAAQRGEDFFERPYVGASFDTVTARIGEALGLDRPTGALVTNVTKDSPAARAGLRSGDLILQAEGKPVQHPEGLEYRLATMPLGSAVKLIVLRDESQVEIELAIERAPDSDAKPLSIAGNSPFAGVTVQELGPRLAQRLRLSVDLEGVVVTGMERGTPAARVGLRIGDIVREVNGEAIETASDLAEITSSGARWWQFTIERDGRLMRQVIRY